MDFSQIKEGLSWFGEKVNEAIWGVVFQAASNFATESFNLITKFIVTETKPQEFFQYSDYLSAMQSIALALLLIAIVWEGVKFQSGSFGEDITLQTLIIRTGFASVCIYFLPWSVTNLFIKLNNLLVKMIQSAGVEIKPGNNVFAALAAPPQLSQMLIVMLLILSIALIGLSIVSGIRYIEIIILTLLAPLAAVSIVRGGDLLDTWIREVIAVVFTQSLQIFLLQLLINVIGKMNSNGIEIYIPAIGATVIMIMGPNALRKFVYSTGAGSAGVRQVGNLGRMAVYKAIASGGLK